MHLVAVVVALLLGEASTACAQLTDSLYAAALTEDGVPFVGGAFGTIARAEGTRWRVQSSGTTDAIFSLDFADKNAGWAVGRSGLILKTSDGGHRWARQMSGVDDKHLFAVDFVDAQFGAAVGDWGTIVVTGDGGTSWQQHSLPDDIILNSVHMIDRTQGWIVGEVGAVLSTSDGGITWVEHKLGIDKTFFSVRFTDALHGWIVGIDGLIVQTEDGGATWQIRHGSAEMAVLDQVGFAQAFDTPSLYAIEIAGEYGVAVGEIGAVFSSHDAGRSWEREKVPADWELRWFRDVALDKTGSGIIAGAEGFTVRIDRGRLMLDESVDKP